MIKTLIVYGVDIVFLSGKDQLVYLSKLAVERFNSNQSFTDDEVLGYLGAVEKVHSKAAAAAVINLAKTIHARYNGKITFNMALVEAAHSILKLGGMPENYGSLRSDR